MTCPIGQVARTRGCLSNITAQLGQTHAPLGHTYRAPSNAGALDKHALPEFRQDLTGDWAGLPGTDRPPVKLDHGDDLGAGPREKALVRTPQVVAGEIRLPFRDPHVPGDVDDRAAGDPFQGTLGGRGRENLALVDD